MAFRGHGLRLGSSSLNVYRELVALHPHSIVDIHSHLGVGPSPALSGAQDDNSLKGLVLPWLRMVDGLNTHDDSYELSIAGGVTTSLVLPGSADAMGIE